MIGSSDSSNTVSVYSIRDLETLSGIKAHTIRIWEKRYGLLKPRRTDTNIRYYLDGDLKYLLNIALLNRNGYKISKIASMNTDDVTEAVLKISADDHTTEIESDALTLAMLEMNEVKFNAIVQKRINENGFEKTMAEVIFPFLNRLSILWMTGSVSPVQENYIAGLIKQKIYVAIDRLPAEARRQTFILYLPEGEHQELSLLFIHYVLRSLGFKVINLGKDISLNDLSTACDIHKPEFIFTLVNEGIPRTPVRDYVEELSLYCRQSKVMLSGIQLNRQNIKSRKNYLVFDDLDEILAFIHNIE
ncbi:MAG: MerR family transcriptional regulator [Saprospiraceae bacterium]|nr:MerR family transcriptional regulator [Saprospiraceae bacterium]